MTVYERIEQLAKTKGISFYRISEDTGIPRPNFYLWKNGSSSPKADKVKILAEYFGVSPEYIMFGDGTKNDVVDLIYKMADDSMSPYILKNDVLIYKDVKPKDGDICIINFNGNQVVRELRSPYYVALDYKCTPITINEVNVVGVVTEIRRYL